MALPSDWKMGKFLEWHTQLPFKNQSRESPTFLIQNNECYFQFCRVHRYENRKSDYYYDVSLKPKRMDCQLNPFSFVIYGDYLSPGNFIRTGVKYSTPDNYIHSFPQSAISNRGPAFDSGYFVKFCFIFLKEDEPLLRLGNKIHEKSIQADLMLSLQADVEYLSSDFGGLLERGDLTDVQLLCNGGNIPAHRAILAARSKTFSDMMLDSTEDSKKDLINFTTTEKSVMELCLEFTYKGKILNLPIEKASNLYALGHDLKILSLMKMCADLMISNLSDDNYISYLVLADKFNDDDFKCGVINYISDHTAILKSESWIKFTDEYMKTAIEVYKKCMFKFI